MGSHNKSSPDLFLPPNMVDLGQLDIGTTWKHRTPVSPWPKQTTNNNNSNNNTIYPYKATRVRYWLDLYNMIYNIYFCRVLDQSSNPTVQRPSCCRQNVSTQWLRCFRSKTLLRDPHRSMARCREHGENTPRADQQEQENKQLVCSWILLGYYWVEAIATSSKRIRT